MSQQPIVADAEGAKPAAGKTWPALLIGLVVAIVWSARHGFRATAEMSSADDRIERLASLSGYATGGALVAAVLVWAAIYFLWVRQRRPQAGAPHFVILLVASIGTALLVANLAGAVKDNRATEATLKRLGADYYAQIDQDTAGYKREFEAIGLKQILTPETLAHADFPALRARIQSGHALVARYHALQIAHRAQMRERIAKADIGEANRVRALRGFDRGAASVAPISDRNFALEDQMLSEADGVIQVLARSKGQWSASGPMIQFRRPADLAEFDAHMDAIRRLSAEEIALVAQINARRAKADAEFRTPGPSRSN
jgi:hypothetical protein